MTNRELKRLKYLNCEIARYDDQITLLEDPSLVASPSGMPHAQGISDRTAQAAIRLASLRLKREAARLDVIDEIQRLTDYIESIDDPLIRQIMQYRHVNGLSWMQVAAHIGGQNTEDSVKKMHERYLAEH